MNWKTYGQESTLVLSDFAKIFNQKAKLWSPFANQNALKSYMYILQIKMCNNDAKIV